MYRTLSTTSGTYYIIVVFCEYRDRKDCTRAGARPRARSRVCVFRLSPLSLCDNEPAAAAAVVETYIAQVKGATSARAHTYLTDHFF
jgi:hypothetical protein